MRDSVARHLMDVDFETHSVYHSWAPHKVKGDRTYYSRKFDELVPGYRQVVLRVNGELRGFVLIEKEKIDETAGEFLKKFFDEIKPDELAEFIKEYKDNVEVVK